MKELLNIYNEELEEVGTVSREEVHKKGLKHKVVHCWIIEKTEEEIFIYFQQRAFNKSDFPGMYDIACAGHIDAGEEIIIAMVREVKEEIGLNISQNDLKYIGRKFETFEIDEFHDDEICEMYILEVNDKTIFNLGEEVEDMVKVSFNEYKKWVNRKIKFLKAQSICNNKEVRIEDENICPHIKEYNEQLIKAI